MKSFPENVVRLAWHFWRHGFTGVIHITVVFGLTTNHYLIFINAKFACRHLRSERFDKIVVDLETFYHGKLGNELLMRQSAKNGLPFRADETPVLAWLSAPDFARARKHRGFSIWTDRREFRDERDALFLGYGCAGVTAFRQLVPFVAFERWTHLTGASCDVMGLDEFAAHWRWRLENPDKSIVGRFRETFEECRIVTAHGAQSVPIRAELFQRWTEDFVRLGLFAVPHLDEYAAHAISCCVASRV